MLTEGQIKYLAKIPENLTMVIKPFNPRGLEIANQIIAEIKATIPLEVVCIGSLPLKIAGQEDIDINVFCLKTEQEKYVGNLRKLFGEPGRIGKSSIGWSFNNEGFSVDVWLTDPTAETTKAQLKIFNMLKENSELLREYEEVKLASKDLTYKQYQINKYEFYNRVLGL